MKVLSTEGLTKLIQLIKSAFISIDDTITTSTIDLADVATSGDYNDLSNKPTIPDTTNLVTTNTAQNITGTKSFVGGNKLILKQDTATSRPGFIITDPNANEVGSLQYRPNAIGTNAMLNLNSPGDTYLGFRYWGTSSNTYNLLMPLPSIANNKFTAGDYYFPLGFTDGTTTIQTAQTGVVDLSGLSFLDSSDIVSSVTSSSTNYKAVGAKLFYDTVGNIETLLSEV